MGVDKDALKRLHGKIVKQAIRMNYYPACSRPDLVLGVSPHSDTSTITLLLQDDDISGLQIRHREGWVPVKPIPDTIVANIGDVTEGWSNGVYKSGEHRAVTNVTAARMSVATFVIQDDDVELGSVETMVGDYNRPVMYRASSMAITPDILFQRKWMEKPSPSFTKYRISAILAKRTGIRKFNPCERGIACISMKMPQQSTNSNNTFYVILKSNI